MNNSFKIANSISMIDDDLILEADKIAERKSAHKKAIYLRYTAAAAACLCIAAGSAVLVRNRTVPDPIVSSGITDIKDPDIRSLNIDSDNSVTSSTNIPIIRMSGVYFNEASSPDAGGARLYFDPEKYDEITLDKRAVLEYYGKELTPSYIPEGLIPQKRSGTVTMFAEKDGKIVYDTVGLTFYHDYYEDGSPKLTENVAATKGFSIEASKLGMPFHCGCFSLKDTATAIGGTEVMFGHYSMPYGPFDPETHKPSGYYNMYVAELEFDSISYRVITSQLESDEIVKIVSSIIYGDSFSVEE